MDPDVILERCLGGVPHLKVQRKEEDRVWSTYQIGKARKQRKMISFSLLSHLKRPTGNPDGPILLQS
jgi:hypothetical protein